MNHDTIEINRARSPDLGGITDAVLEAWRVQKERIEKREANKPKDMNRLYFNDVCMPLAPAKMTVVVENRNTTVDLASGGVYKVLNAPGLTTYEFELILPHDEHSIPFATYRDGFKKPQYYLDMFEKMKNADKTEDRIFKFLMVEDKLDPHMIFQMNCTLEDYEIVQDADEHMMDFVVSMTIQRYDRHTTQEFSIKKDANGNWVAEKNNINTNMQAAADAIYMINRIQEELSKNTTRAVNMTTATAELMKSRREQITVQNVKSIAKKNGLNPTEGIAAGVEIKT